MNSKGAIGLSINVIVLIIISLVILALGINLLYTFIEDTNQLHGDIDERTKQELEKLLIQGGNLVALPFDNVDLLPSQSHSFGLGIRNIRGEGDFQVRVILARMAVPDNPDLLADNQQQKDDIVNKWLLYNTGNIPLKEHDSHTETILVTVPADTLPGKYIFRVEVRKSGQEYANPQLFIVNVT